MRYLRLDDSPTEPGRAPLADSRRVEADGVVLRTPGQGQPSSPAGGSAARTRFLAVCSRGAEVVPSLPAVCWS